MTFEYLPDGILVEGRWYPLLRMDWVEGVHLSKWLDSHHQNQRAVTAMANRFAALVEDLSEAKVAHGDLQHGNLLVAPDDTLRLVDYDGLYVPALAGRRSTETGHRNYQSPLRDIEDFGPNLDRFSAWVIYASLTAVAADPTLWTQLHEPDSEYLILAEDDFREPASSAHFPALLHHADPVIRDLGSRLRGLTTQPLSALPQLHAPDTTAERQMQPAEPVGISPDTSANQSGRPQWLEDHLSNSVTRSYLVTASQMPTFRVRRIGEFLLASFGLFSLLAPLAAWITNSLSSILATIATLISIPLFLLLSAAARITRSEVRVLRYEKKSIDQLLNLADQAASTYTALAEERDRHASAEEERAMEIADRHRELTRQLHQVYARIESEKNTATGPIDQEMRGLSAEQENATSQKLHPLQQSWVDQRLSLRSIADAHLSMITSKNLNSLAAHSIQTAADFVGIEFIKGRSDAQLKTPDGNSVKVPGVGLGKARILLDWRQRCEEKIRTSCPIILPREQQQEIEAIFKPRMESLRKQREALDQETERKRSGARSELAIAREQITEMYQQELDISRAQRLELDRKDIELRSTASEIDRLNQSRHLLAAHAHRLSLTRYIRFLFLAQ
ncbi:AarF/UbiB family protein [Streptomyces sp. NPDC047009]|uniref:AarF/UbiB family protein n=1 Tax=Streptomyces sp. NPDC047009 TaxID=3154496 RepID=UPI0033F7C747